MAKAAVYGQPPPRVAAVPPGAAQTSPLIPGSQALEAMPDASLETCVVLAPPGAVERRFVLAHALRATRPGGPMAIAAPKTAGGARLEAEMDALGVRGWAVEARAHHKVLSGLNPPADEAALAARAAAIMAGGPVFSPDLDMWTQPGVFSWNRIDPGSAALLATLPALPVLTGAGADLGCGLGVLARAVLRSPSVVRLVALDIDRRAVEAARRNLEDPRADVRWADARGAAPRGLDFVVMNPPFHDGGAEDRALGQAFIAAAAEALRPGGRLILTANTHLPYEAVLRRQFAKVEALPGVAGYKLFEALR